jgi:hypothetical protein
MTDPYVLRTLGPSVANAPNIGQVVVNDAVTIVIEPIAGLGLGQLLPHTSYDNTSIRTHRGPGMAKPNVLGGGRTSVASLLARGRSLDQTRVYMASENDQNARPEQHHYPQQLCCFTTYY